jgi:hypothetical protein
VAEAATTASEGTTIGEVVGDVLEESRERLKGEGTVQD